MLTTAADVLDALGTSVVSSLTGVKRATVSGWKYRRSIPAVYFFVLEAELDARNLTFDAYEVFGFMRPRQ